MISLLQIILQGTALIMLNLSAKGVLGIAAYARLAEMLNKKEEAEKYMNAAGEMAKEWEMAAYAGDHYRLAFDQPDRLGDEYNLVWDRLLGLNLFPKRVIQKETDFYLTKMNEFGCPLDSRHSYTKVDWTVWTASLSADRMQFRKLMLPLHKFMNETTDRTPMADLINTGWENYSRIYGAYCSRCLFYQVVGKGIIRILMSFRRYIRSNMI